MTEQNTPTTPEATTLHPINSNRTLGKISGRTDSAAAWTAVTGLVLQHSSIHGTRMFGKVPGVRQYITAYLKKNVGGRPTDAVYGSVNSDVYHAAGSPELPPA